MTPEVLKNTIDDDNPAGILRAIKKMRHRGTVGFHLADLETARRGWAKAAFASAGTPSLVTACAVERDKFQHWVNELKSGMLERQEAGVMILEPKDWPPVPLIDSAIAALEYADIRSIH